MYPSLTEHSHQLLLQPGAVLVHTGLPASWAVGVLVVMLLLLLYMLQIARRTEPSRPNGVGLAITQLPLIGKHILRMTGGASLLVGLRIIGAILFLVVIYTGLFGTTDAEKNPATVLVWTYWWFAVVLSILFAGSAWCAVCPWDVIATWLVRGRLWRKGREAIRQQRRVPKMLRNIWPAWLMLVLLTWLELGMQIRFSPFATALLALAMLVLAVVSLIIYERKAFCRYFCAVGRTIGVYSSLSPIALRPLDAQTCASCRTLECYNGTEEVEPCPTHLVMGRLTQNTYCTSCSACVLSCPYHNVHWRLRPLAGEASYSARPHRDEAWFVVTLLALVQFQGLVGNSVLALSVLTATMLVVLSLSIALFALTSWISFYLLGRSDEYQRVFTTLATVLLPLAFVFHLAYNIRGLPESNTVFVLQSILLLSGYGLSLYVARGRVGTLSAASHGGIRVVIPVYGLVSLHGLCNLGLLMLP